MPNSHKILDGLSILVVDDVPDLLFLLRFGLEHNGALVDTAADGKTALRLADPGRHDAIVMDVHLPDMSGIDCLRQLRSRGFASPVLAVSAMAFKSDIEAGLAAGFSFYLTKPFEFDSLLQFLCQILGRPGPKKHLSN